MLRRRLPCIAVLAAAFVLPGTAKAELKVFTFSGTIGQYDDPAAPDDSLKYVKSAFTGQFSFDPAVAPVVVSPTQERYVLASFSFSSLFATTSGSGRLSLTRYGSVDSLSYFADTAGDWYRIEGTASLPPSDPGTPLPTTLAGRSFSIGGPGTGNRFFTGTFIVDADAVPEPASWAMLIVGFGIAGGAMRRGGGRSASAKRRTAHRLFG